MTIEERFKTAVEHAKEFLGYYKELGPVGIFGASMIQRDLDLYEAGDRSEALLKSLESIE